MNQLLNQKHIIMNYSSRDKITLRRRDKTRQQRSQSQRKQLGKNLVAHITKSDRSKNLPYKEGKFVVDALDISKIKLKKIVNKIFFWTITTNFVADALDKLGISYYAYSWRDGPPTCIQNGLYVIFGFSRNDALDLAFGPSVCISISVCVCICI